MVFLGPLTSSGRPGRQSTSSRQDLFVITYKYRGQSARMHKTGSNKIQLTTKPILSIDHDFRRFIKLVSYFSELRLIY